MMTRLQSVVYRIYCTEMTIFLKFTMDFMYKMFRFLDSKELYHLGDKSCLFIRIVVPFLYKKTEVLKVTGQSILLAEAVAGLRTCAVDLYVCAHTHIHTHTHPTSHHTLHNITILHTKKWRPPWCKSIAQRLTAAYWCNRFVCMGIVFDYLHDPG